MTQIVAGEFRSRKLTSAGDKITRPTMQRTREAVFNVLTHNDFDRGFSLRDASVLDVFAGTGAYGIEALSRGAKNVIFIEKNPKAAQAIRQNIATLKIEDRTQIMQSDAIKLGTNKNAPYGLVFIDPPYDQNLVVPTIIASQKGNWADQKSLFVVEVRTSSRDEMNVDMIDIVKESTYGESTILFAYLKEPV